MSSAPLSQRRQHEWEDVQAVVEIAAEKAIGDHRGQIAVGSRHESYVDANRLCAAQALELLFLQHAKQLRLQLGRNVAGFVQEQRPLVRQLETADFLADRASKRAFLVAE